MQRENIQEKLQEHSTATITINISQDDENFYFSIPIERDKNT